MERSEIKAVNDFLKQYQIKENLHTFSIVRKDAEKFLCATGIGEVSREITVVWLEK